MFQSTFTGNIKKIIWRENPCVITKRICLEIKSAYIPIKDLKKTKFMISFKQNSEKLHNSLNISPGAPNSMYICGKLVTTGNYLGIFPVVKSLTTEKKDYKKMSGAAINK